MEKSGREPSRAAVSHGSQFGFSGSVGLVSLLCLYQSLFDSGSFLAACASLSRPIPVQRSLGGWQDILQAGVSPCLLAPPEFFRPVVAY